MTKRMLVDGVHAEETRIVVMSGDQLTDYDLETRFKKQIKGNIYLAKVVRVEPALQAAFIEFGGDRHGFLALSDIHPDYYQIPIEDRQKLMAEQETLELGARAAREHLEDIDGGTGDDEIEEDDGAPAKEDADANAGEAEQGGAADSEPDEQPAPVEPPPVRLSRHYKIQEVIKRRQIMLVQVVKEERGTKGAALTTYISLAGRCCVLMPNTSRGGGVSRRITNVKERRKLKDILNSLEIAEGIGVIIRTAGSDRSKAEIRRDFEYLLKVWDKIRQTTLESTAPCLIHEEADIIKRTLRDVYSRDVSEILVEGTDAYRRAKEFMRLMMPSHAKRVQPFREEATSLFQKFRIEEQLDAMYNPTVPLKSGGSLVINQTEALVAIDVNSGQSTRERNIERTALKTNMEAADEVARQLRLRDLSGLIVVDFIDMDENRNSRKVERRFREVVKNDRARMQVGQISEFGLLELSRQRLRPSLIETSSQICQHCQGTGAVLSTEAMALRALRNIESEGSASPNTELTVHVPSAVALYILNYKRGLLGEIEARYNLTTILQADESAEPPDISIENARSPSRVARQSRSGTEKPASENEARSAIQTQQRGEPKTGRRRRGRRRSAEGEPAAQDESPLQTPPEEAAQDEQPTSGEASGAGRRRRRSRRRKSESRQAPVSAEQPREAAAEAETNDDAGEETANKRRRRRRSRTASEPVENTVNDASPESQDTAQPVQDDVEEAVATPNEPEPPIAADEETPSARKADADQTDAEVEKDESEPATASADGGAAAGDAAAQEAGEGIRTDGDPGDAAAGTGPAKRKKRRAASKPDSQPPPDAPSVETAAEEPTGLNDEAGDKKEDDSPPAEPRAASAGEADGGSKRKPRKASRKKSSKDADEEPTAEGNGSAAKEDAPEATGQVENGGSAVAVRENSADMPEDDSIAVVPPPETQDQAKRSGWWQRNTE